MQSLLLRQSLMSPVTQIQVNLNANTNNLKNKLYLTLTHDSLLIINQANFSLTIDENIRTDAANGIIINNWKRHNRYLLISIAWTTGRTRNQWWVPSLYLPNGDGNGRRFLRCWGTQGLREDTRFCLHRLQTPFSRCRTGCH